MAGLVTHLLPGERLDPGCVFEGPWLSIETAILAAGQELHLDNERSESAVFVERGGLSLALPNATVLMGAGDAVTLVKGETSTVTAGPGGARLFITRLKADS